MPRCGPFIGEKPCVLKDEDGWKASQVTTCLKCRAVDWTDLDSETTFEQALKAALEDAVPPCNHPRAVATRVVGEYGYWKCPDCGHQTGLEKLDD